VRFSVLSLQRLVVSESAHDLHLPVQAFDVSNCVAAAQATSHPTQQADEAAIRVIVSHWQQAWDNFNASVLDGDYAEDADWMNAFGAKEKGATKIMLYMVEVVKRPSVAGRHTV
jgi:hypothetical protein